MDRSQIAHRHMYVEIGAEAALFPEKEYMYGIFVAVQKYDMQAGYLDSRVPDGGVVHLYSMAGGLKVLLALRGTTWHADPPTRTCPPP